MPANNGAAIPATSEDMTMDKKSAEYKALREKFTHYFLDLQDDARADGYSVSRADEWDRFVAAHLEELAAADAADIR